MCTAKGQTEDIVEAFALGANDYVTKPIDIHVALARITSQLTCKRAVAALKESEMRYSLAARGANDGLWDWDLQSNKIFYSSRWKSMLGYDETDIGESPDAWFERVHPEDLPQVQAALAAHRQGLTTHFESEHRLLHKDSLYRWVFSRAMAVRGSDGRELRMAGSLTDITRGKAIDSLTGLPNRALFMDRLRRVLERPTGEPSDSFAVLFLDVDRFKIINDSLGHLAGDQLLKSIGTRLEKCLRSTDKVYRSDGLFTVARFGGDEFTILLNDIREVDEARSVTARLIEALSEPFILNGQEVYTGVSIGIALNDGNYKNAEEILRDADTAMYRAKMEGKGRFVVFDQLMRTDAVVRLQIETDLRRAVERREFCLHYQPIVLLTSERIVGFEALLRWNHPERGLMPPADFVRVAEETGLIASIGIWALREACRQMVAWQLEFPQHPAQFMCVNLSPIQFKQPSLVTDVAKVLTETGLEPEHLKLEITEGVIMNDPEQAAVMLVKLRELGVLVGIDDFGTGYSSLSYLHQFPITTLKIDRSFVSRMNEEKETSKIIETIVSLAHNLSMNVVAEGVERSDQQDRLRDIACEFGQGYFFSKPVPGEEIAQLLSTGLRLQNTQRVEKVLEAVAV